MSVAPSASKCFWMIGKAGETTPVHIVDKLVIANKVNLTKFLFFMFDYSLKKIIVNKMFVARRGARLLDEVERSEARRVQMARAWPRAAQHKYDKLIKFFFDLLFKNDIILADIS